MAHILTAAQQKDQDDVRALDRRGSQGAAPTNIDGQTLEEFFADAREEAASTPAGRLTLLKAEQTRRRVSTDRLETLKAEQARRTANSIIDTSPLPTGITRIDRAGEDVIQGGAGQVPSFAVRQPSLDDLPFDHPDKIRKQRADEGIDMISGADFRVRKEIASAPGIPRLRDDTIKAALLEQHNSVPEGIESVRYDTALEEFQILMPSEQTEGKFRWTSLDGTGLELGDLGDLFDPAEIGAAIGGIVGTFLGPGKVRFLTMTKARPAVGGFSGAVLGRTIGDSIKLVKHFKETGNAPTYEELATLAGGGLATEFLASVLSEAGAKILRVGSNMTQELAARSINKQAVHTGGDVEILNENIRIAKGLMEDLNKDGAQFAVTPGQATRSVSLLASEARALKGASADTKAMIVEAAAKNDKALEAYVRREFDTDLASVFERSEGIIVRANDSISSVGEFAILQTSKGNVHIMPKLIEGRTADAGVYGVTIKTGKDVWQVKTAQIPEDAQRLGLARNSYIVAAEEAQARGAVLASDGQLSKDAIALWKNLDETQSLGKLKWADPEDLFEPVAGSGRLSTHSGDPVVQMVTPEPFTTQLLDTFMVPGRGEGGRIVANKEFRDFLRAPGKLLGPIIKEMEDNPFTRQQMKEAILSDYSKRVKSAKGGFNDTEWGIWKDETRKVVEEVFSPEEVLRIRSTPNGLRNIVTAGREAMLNRRTALSKQLGVDINDKLFLDPSNKALLTQLKGRTPDQRRRIMRILDASDMGDTVRSVYMRDLQELMMKKIKGKDWQGMDAFIKDNKAVIEDVMGNTEYNSALRTVAHVLGRKSDANMIRGAAADMNPTGLALFRVAFGPLSRIQRGLTGARRGMVRINAARATDLLTSPDMLKELVRILPFEIESRIVARVIQSTGLAEALGFPQFDSDDPQQRRVLAAQVMTLLQDEGLTSGTNGP